MIARAKPGRTLLALCALCWLAFPAQASDESLANRPFVEAAKLIRTAEEEAGFVRLVSNPRIFERPSSIMAAWRQMESWLAADSAWIPLPTERHREAPRPLIPIPPCWWLCKSARRACMANNGCGVFRIGGAGGYAVAGGRADHGRGSPEAGGPNGPEHRIETRNGTDSGRRMSAR